MDIDDAEGQMETGKADYIVEELKAQILEGKLPERTKLPSERELSEQYDVSRMTARRALQILEGEGLVTRHPVRGTFVSGIRERQHEHHGIVAASELREYGSFKKAMFKSGRKPEELFLEQPSLVAANVEVAEHLQLPQGSLVLKRYRLQSADKLPYRLIESYYPSDLFGELLTTNIGDTPLFDWLQERHGLTDVRAKEDLIARLAIPDERSLLQISPNAPVVAFERTVWANNDRVIEWARITAVALLYTFSYEYDIPARTYKSRT